MERYDTGQKGMSPRRWMIAKIGNRWINDFFYIRFGVGIHV
jgi:hypothetical protein